MSHLTAQTSLPLSLSTRRDWAAEQSISYLMQQGLVNRDVISLAAGFVDEVTLPVELVQNAMQRIFADRACGQRALQYGSTGGNVDLQTQLLNHLARLEHCSLSELGIEQDQIIVTAGSQQLLNHVSEVLLDPGDICLVSAPTYFVFLGTLNGVGATTIAVESDENGMKMDALEATLSKLEAAGDLPRVKLIYLVSSFENPSGMTLADDRRRTAVDLARRFSKSHRILILEDAAYRELRYEGEDGSSIWNCDETREHVILAQTFSKSFSPGIRVAYGIVPKDLVTPIHDVKGNFDFGSPNLSQQIVAEVLRDGSYESHVGSLCQSYTVKRDAMLRAADAYFSDIPDVSWRRPQGGLYVWMSLPPSVATGYESVLFERATKQEGVMYVPGEIAYPIDSPLKRTNEMRLSFGVESPETIDDGMRRLAKAVRHALDQAPLG
jgi:2-aminoadipate transaminase